MELAMDQAFCGSATLSEALDQFDLLPDAVILLIFNKLEDVKILGSCCSVSKRFHALATQVGNLVLKVDCIICAEDSSSLINSKEISFLNSFMRLFLTNFIKPLQELQHWMTCKTSTLTRLAYHSPIEVLKNFHAIKRLRIELPAGELGVEKGVLLKWRAEFGSTLERCIILGAASCLEKKDDKYAKDCDDHQNLQQDRSFEYTGAGRDDDNGSLPESFYTDGGLKLRVVWTISSLIAASARHFLLRQIVSDHPTLESLVLTDSDGQGVLCMSKSQLRDFCENPCPPSPSSSRTQVPALSMRLCYAPYLELPGGTSLEGATLVSVRPVDHQPTCKDGNQFLGEAFEEPYRTAVSNLLKRRTYMLEMNSF